MSNPIFMMTLQGTTADGNCLIETWRVTKETYLDVRSQIGLEPSATSLTDRQGHLISTRFSGDGE